MSLSARKAALKLPGLPKNPNKKVVKGDVILKIGPSSVVKSLSPSDVQNLIGKTKQPVTIDLSCPQFQLESSSWLKDSPDLIKVLNLSSNCLSEFGQNGVASKLTKLKRLELANNAITTIQLIGLSHLEMLNLSSNKIAAFPDMSDLGELVYLDVSGNRLTGGFTEIGKLKELKVLDLGDCGLDLPLHDFLKSIMSQIKKLSKLEYLNFNGNPVHTGIKEFRYFVIHQLPKLKYLNWELISKEDRTFAGDLAASSIWDASPTPPPPKQPEQKATPPPALNTSTQVPSNPHASTTLDELDELLNSTELNSTPKSSSLPKQLAPIDDLDALLSAVEGTGQINNVPGNRSSYMDLISGMLQDDFEPKPKPGPTSPPAPSSGKDVDYMDELDNLIHDTFKNQPIISTVPVQKSPSITNISSPTAISSTPPPPSRVASQLQPLSNDSIDDLLGELDASLAQPERPPSAPAPRKRAAQRNSIFEDLESDILDLVSDINSSSSASISPSTSQLSLKSSSAKIENSQTTPKIEISQPVTPKTPATPKPPTTIADHSDLDELENEIASLSASTPAAPVVAAPVVAAPAPVAETVKPVAESKIEPKVVIPEPRPESPKPVPPQQAYPPLGYGLASLANFTANITAQELDSIMDDFENKAPPIHKDTIGSTSMVSPSNSSSNLSVNSSPASARSLQRGPRASVANLPAVQKPAAQPWEIPLEDLLMDFMLGKGTWGETLEGSWRVDQSNFIPATFKRLYNKDFSTESVAKFRQETKELLALKHPHLVPLLGCSVKDCKVLVWKGVGGVPLWGYLRNPNNRITSRQVLRWARQIASALQFLHQENVLHGGLKTQNILIDKENNAILKDFGFLDFKDEINVTDADPRWLAPELLTSKSDGYNEKIDVYAFAMVLYEMVSRESPFSKLKPKDILEIVPHRLIRPDPSPTIFPPVFIRLLSACWNNDPEARPSMEKLCAILKSDEEAILGDHADIPLDIPDPRNTPNAVTPRMSRLSTPALSSKIVLNNFADSKGTIDHSIASSPSSSASSGLDINSIIAPVVAAKMQMTTRPPAASFGADLPAIHQSRPILRAVKPVPIKPLEQEDFTLPPDQERKLAALLSKLQEMISSGDPESQLRALNTTLEVVKDDKRINYTATKSHLPRDLVELLRSNSVDAVNSWRYEFPMAFEVVENILNVITTLSRTTVMGLAFTKYKAHDILGEFVLRGVDSLKILAATAVYELCQFPEGRTGAREAALLNILIGMLKNKNEFVQTQGAWTLSSYLEDDMNRDDFVIAGGLPSLNQALQSTNAALRLRVLDALSNFWSVPQAQELITSSQMKEKLVNMLASTSTMLKSTAVRAISRLTNNQSFELTELEALRILKSLMEIVQDAEMSVRDRIAALKCCESLTRDKSSAANFRDIGGLSMMVKLLSDATVEIRASAIAVIQRSLVDEKSRDALIALGSVAPLVSQLASSATSVRIRAIYTLDVLRHYPKGQSAIIANAGLPRIVSVVAFSRDPEEIVLALQILDYFSDNAEFKEAVREAGGLTALIEGIHNFPPKGKFYACVNLGHLCSTEKNRQALVEQKGLQPLLVTVSRIYRAAESDHSLSPQASEPFNPNEELYTLLNISLNLIFNISEVGEWRNALRDCDAADLTCQWFATQNESLKIHAARTLTALAKDPRNRVIIKTGAGKTLKELALNCANQTLSKLCSQVLVLIDAQ